MDNGKNLTHEHFMKLAVEEARQGIRAGHGGPFGSVIVRDGKVIAKGHNMVVANNDPTCHGEVSAIRNACRELGTFDLSGCDIYTTGEPCPMCLGACLWANLGRIYYGATSLDIDGIGFRDDVFYRKIESKQDILEQAGREDCLELFEEYKNLKDKTAY